MRLKDDSARAAPASVPTVWGLCARQLHDAYWSAMGVQCLRQPSPVDQETSAVVDRTADLYLLLESNQAVVFDLSSMIERIVWHGAAVTRIRITDASPIAYDERIICDREGLVQRIERCYGHRAEMESGARRVFITDRPWIAERWLTTQTPRDGWTSIRRAFRGRAFWGRIDRLRVPGRSFNLRSARDEPRLLDALVTAWDDPGQVIDGIAEVAPGVWKPARDDGNDAAGLIGPVWLGFGRATPSEVKHSHNGRAPRQCIVGPAWLTDDAEALSAARHLEGRSPVSIRSIIDIDLAGHTVQNRRKVAMRRRSRRVENLYPAAKRAFDVTASAAILLLSLPLMMIIAVAIMLNDGRPILFRHKRQTRGGRTFHCLKFRTMQRNAENIVADLRKLNLCDGPQVYIQDDPRVTRVGHILRSTHLDELPQLWNVLIGEMSLVGPRPSPDNENRYCPAWRELRLSVRPGITGLWQLKRTRSPGQDFQEWIRFDIEYVRNASFLLDMRILVETLRLVLFGRKRDEERTT